MIDHVAAIEAAFAAAGLVSHFVDAPGATPPYHLLWTGSGTVPAEASVDPAGDFTDTLGVTSVAGTPKGALIAQREAREALAPFAAGSTVVAGRIVWLTLYDSRSVQVDRDVTVTSTNRHPAYAVDMYRLVSVPA